MSSACQLFFDRYTVGVSWSVVHQPISSRPKEESTSVDFWGRHSMSAGRHLGKIKMLTCPLSDDRHKPCPPMVGR